MTAPFSGAEAWKAPMTAFLFVEPYCTHFGRSSKASAAIEALSRHMLSDDAADHAELPRRPRVHTLGMRATGRLLYRFNDQ
jgi:hypothetical protein